MSIKNIHWTTTTSMGWLCAQNQCRVIALIYKTKRKLSNRLIYRVRNAHCTWCTAIVSQRHMWWTMNLCQNGISFQSQRDRKFISSRSNTIGSCSPSRLVHSTSTLSIDTRHMKMCSKLNLWFFVSQTFLAQTHTPLYGVRSRDRQPIFMSDRSRQKEDFFLNLFIYISMQDASEVSERCTVVRGRKTASKCEETCWR